MLSRFEHKGLVWIDLESPTRQEIVSVAAEFNLDAFVAEELLLPSTKPRADFHPAYTYVVMHFPSLRHSHKSREQEVDFVIGPNFLVTTHYDTIDPLHKFSKVFEVDSMLDTGNLGDHGVYLFFYMLKRFYRSIEHEIEYIRRDMSNIEEHVFSEHQVEMVAALSRSARDLLNLRQTIEPHRDVLRSLEEDGPATFGAISVPYLKALTNEYYRVHNHIMRCTESLHELRETNNSLLTTRQNETMRILTVMALLTFPLSLFVAIFDINTVDNPFSGVPHGWWLIVAIVITTGVSMFLFFKKKKWL